MSGVVSRLFGLAPAPSTSSEYTKTARADAAFCDAKPSVARAFCREDLPDARAKIVAELRQHLRRCSWSRSAPAAHWSQFVARPDTRLWAVRSRFMRQRESAFEREYGYSQTYPNASVSMTDYRGGEREDARMEHCDTPEWTFERVGPFAGRGQLWHSAGWRDAGGFGAHLARAAAPIYVTAFGFHPTSSSGEALGYPPVMIHHMHVTSSQSMARDTRSANFLRRSRDGFFAVEFDVHGDRQCAAAAGGVNCTVRAFPPGFGLRITDTMETFFDLNDVRDAGSAPLQFYAQHSYRWTRAAQRPVGKMLTLISTEAFKPHDDYLLEFDPEQPTEYLYWQEGTMPASLSMVHMYWHAHHAWTDDIWLVDASADALRLRPLFGGGMFVNLTSHGHTVASAKAKIEEQLRAAQRACAHGAADGGGATARRRRRRPRRLGRKLPHAARGPLPDGAARPVGARRRGAHLAVPRAALRRVERRGGRPLHPHRLPRAPAAGAPAPRRRREERAHALVDARRVVRAVRRAARRRRQGAAARAVLRRPDDEAEPDQLAVVVVAASVFR